MLRRATGMLFDRALGVREELLLEEADARPASERDVPRVGRALPRREPQERGLADPVRPDEPDPIGLGEPERDLAEDQPFAEALRDGLDRQDAHGRRGRGAAVIARAARSLRGAR